MYETLSAASDAPSARTAKELASFAGTFAWAAYGWFRGASEQPMTYLIIAMTVGS